MTRRHKLAVNPLPWVIKDGRFQVTIDTVAPALEVLGPIGFNALHADIADGLTPLQYKAFLSDYAFTPAPGYFGADFDSADGRDSIVEAARVHAAYQAALGLTEMFIASNLVGPRLEHAARGVEASTDRISAIAETLAAAAAASVAEGVKAALHPHVGSWIETEAEVRGVLDATSGSELAFGPDVGHLAWAGMDPVRMINDYQDRVVAVHLKDVDMRTARQTRDAGTGYFAATDQAHVWQEPGRGGINFDGVFEALTDSFTGWSVVEVDVPALPTAEESSRVSYDFLTAHSFFAEVN